MTAPFTMNSFQGKRVLALVRDGDFAHAGEEESIERTMQGIPKDPERRLLDAGCGRGGTAAYLQEHGWGRVTGIDIEDESIARAHDVYPEPTFILCDINDIEDHLTARFDVITMFNVLYALPDHTRSLRALAGRAAPTARLVVFDYVDRGHYRSEDTNAPGPPLIPNPPDVARLPEILAAGGWEVRAVEEIDDDFVRWYETLVGRIEAKRVEIEALAGVDGYDHVHGNYSNLLGAIRDGRLGGSIVHASRIPAGP